MLSQKQIGILGTGAYVPEAVLTNQNLEKLVETSAEWIVERSGIHERRIAAPEEDTVTMAVLAGRQGLRLTCFYWTISYCGPGGSNSDVLEYHRSAQ